MSQPFSRIPDPESRPPIRRRLQPAVVQEALRGAKRVAQRHYERLWLRGKRNPRTFALIGVATALTLGGAYALSASGIGRSLCPPAGQASSSASKTGKDQKTPRFLLLMDPVPQLAAGSELEIHYDVCGLPSGTPYRGHVRLSRQTVGTKKGSAKPKPLVVTFKDRVDGPATRRRQQLNLVSTRAGAYTLELSVVDSKGRERKKLQKVVIKTR